MKYHSKNNRFVPKVVMGIVFGELREAPVLEIGFSIHESDLGGVLFDFDD